MEKVICLDLGLVDYAKCWDLQRILFDELVAGKAAAAIRRPGATSGQVKASDKAGGCPEAEQYLLLCEHPPVYTLGNSGDEHNLLINGEFLKDKGASFYRTDRGGDITFHGPGQLVGYPILDLEREGMGLKEYIRAIEQAVIDTLAEYGISGTRAEGAAGVWLMDDKPMRKICAIGVRASRYVTMHGFALNANTDLRWFDYINPCGFADRGVTSIAKETAAERVDMAALKSRLTAHLEKILNIKINTTDYANRKALGNQAAGRPTEGG